MAKTVFHKILAKEIPADIVYEDENVLAFNDINPKAPTHILFIAKKESDFVASIAELTDQTEHVPTMLIRTARMFAQEKGIDGYQLKFHVGKDGGQEVPYVHLHFLSQQTL